jgi:hypothetical protein
VTAIAGTWTSGATFAYAWKRSGSTTTLGTGARYTIGAADSGATLTVTVTATRNGFTTLCKTSVATSAVASGVFTTTPVPILTGSAASGATLTAVTTGWYPASGVTFSYVWKRSNTASGTKTVIASESASTYVVRTGDRGKFITVTVTATKAGFTSVTKVSINTAIAP